MFSETIFLCGCVEDTENVGWKIDELGLLTFFYLSMIGHHDDPFIICS